MENIMVKIMGETFSVSPDVTLYELSKRYQEKFKSPILIAKVDNELFELGRKPYPDCNIEFLDISSQSGFLVYQRSAVFILVCAAKDVLGKKTRIVVKHSVNKNYYCELPDYEITENLLTEIEDKMRSLVESDLPIEKHLVPLGRSFSLMDEYGFQDKIDILRFKRSSNASFYKLNNVWNYFYGPMVVSTSFVDRFKLSKSENGFILQFPNPQDPEKLAEMIHRPNLLKVYRESWDWARILYADTVGSLNRIICDGGFENIIRISEALHEKKIAYIADMIRNQNKNIVLIAGPSSSGKTTFAMRLCVQLLASGVRPHLISLDNYFRNRSEAPIGEDGRPDYDCYEFLDDTLLSSDLNALIDGYEIEPPFYNFFSGTREFLGKKLRLGSGDVLLIEGIHALNDRLTDLVPAANKFKIFIGPMTQINIDDHNRFSTSDSRLLRRITRDKRFRGADAKTTLDIWPIVQKGERTNIFPYQESADAIFNSALVYEMCVIKQYVLPLLYRVERSDPQYLEATRLIKALDCFLGATSENIPKNSILREFIGGSCFEA